MDKLAMVKSMSESYKFTACSSQELINKSKALRHLIYCEEKMWEPSKTTLMESDEYDDVSIHYIVSCRKTKRDVATFRLIISNNLPITKYISVGNILHPKEMPLNSVCEISRFSILKEYRGSELLKMLFLLAGYETAKNGLLGAYMSIENKLAIRLKRCKITCQKITDDFLLNGSRAIYYCSTAEVIGSIRPLVGFEKKALNEFFQPIFQDNKDREFT